MEPTDGRYSARGFEAYPAGLTVDERTHELPDGRLRATRISLLDSRPSNAPVLFVSGWGSTPHTWRRFVPFLSASAQVHYLETREKSSSQLSRRASMAVSAVSRDIADYANHTFSGGHYGLVAASTGANAVLEAWDGLQKKPQWLVLILPHADIPIPRSMTLLRFLPRPCLKLVAPVATSFMRNFRLSNVEKAQQEGLFEALRMVDMAKMRDSAVAWRAYHLNPEKLEAIDVPTLVVGAADDRFHPYGAIQQIASRLPAAVLMDQKTFTGAHSKRCAMAVVSWLESSP
ncbi:alpha/beta fold hydrolase [Streptomyces sp. NPDC055287]